MSESNYSDQRARARRMRARKKKRQRQMISLALLFVVVLFVTMKLFSFIASHSSNQDVEVGPAILWHFHQAMESATGDSNATATKMYDAKTISNLALDNADKLDIHLVPNSNHITSAASYAYDAKEIHDIITHKQQYTGNKKVVFLTFDDGPNLTITPQILNVLKEENAHATFFVIGKLITPKHYEMLRREINEGNAIGLHSFSHNYSYLYPGRVGNAERIVEEAKKAQANLQACFGSEFYTNVWRYPGGHMSWKNLEPADEGLKSLGIQWMDWNCLVGDAEVKAVRPTTVQGEVDYVDKSLNQNKQKDIAVVLCHDAENKQLTANSLRSVIKYFRENGYEFGILK